MKIKGTKLEILKALEKYFEKKDIKDIFHCLISKKNTKEMRTLSQNRTFWKLFTDIGNHLGENKEDVHDMMLGGVFGTHIVKIGRITRDVSNEKHTSKLTKEQGVKFIDTILAFCKKYDLPITITPIEIQSLYNSYSKHE